MKDIRPTRRPLHTEPHRISRAFALTQSRPTSQELRTRVDQRYAVTDCGRHQVETWAACPLGREADYA